MASVERREGAVAMRGNPITLLGPQIEANEDAPEFTALKDLKTPVRLSESGGKVRVLLAVPSLDTPVCSTEIKRFNDAAKELGDDVVIYSISVDTPFALARWCGAEGADKVQTLSDFRDRDFGKKYGVEIEGLGIYARAAFVVDRQGVVLYSEYVPDVTSEPNYEAILDAARSAA